MRRESPEPPKPADSLPTQTTDKVGRRGARWWWAAFAMLLMANLPLMICMPLTADPITYDLQAQTALEGGVLYRDLVEPNLPGAVWVHMAVRSVLGWSTYALRGFDLLVFAGVLVLLVRTARGASFARDFHRQTPALGLLLCWFYFSLSEWAHCQRDVWLLLPALGALSLRIHQLRRFSTSDVGRCDLLLWGGLEGILWGTAFWIKPFVAVPALASLVASAFWMKDHRRWLLNTGGVMMGGALCGLCGSVWLIETGAWPHFWDMALNWNPAYFEVGRSRWTFERYQSMVQRFLPWSLIHCAAIPIAIRSLLTLRQTQKIPPGHSLLAAVYLGWLIQAHTLQHLLDYAHVPGILLGLSVVAAAWPMGRPGFSIAQTSLAAFILVALMTSPATRPQRLATWGRCFTEGSSPEVRCALQHKPLPNWEELQPVVDFLKAQNLEDGQVTAYNVFLIHLYPELGLTPPTRYVFLDVHMRIFKDRAPRIAKALEDSPQRFVVSSLLENGMFPKDVGSFSPLQPPRLPAKFPKEELRYFPYNQKLVLRSGQYVVHQVTQPVGPLNTRFFPLDHSIPPHATEPPAQTLSMKNKGPARSTDLRRDEQIGFRE